jgi:V8-like Glu-specific endopeptidase
MSENNTSAGGEGSGEPTGVDQGDEGNISSPMQELATMEQAAEVWTTEAMRDAEPCDIIEIDEDEIAAEEAATQEQDHLVMGGEPDKQDEPSTAEDLELLGYSYPAPFTRWENFCSYTQYPFSAVGKLFFRRGGQSFVCSASSIGGCAIITAGHCLHAGNNAASGWATDVVFVPAYRDGAAPFGQWPARYSTVRGQWYANGISKGLSEDIGGAVLHKQNNRTISQAVGWLGFAWNWPRVQHWVTMGYPAAPPFNGQRQQISAGSYAYDGSVGASPAPMGIGSDLTGGSSGGPWIWRFGSGNHVNGVNSYRRSTHPQEMFSPYFGNAAKALFDSLIAGSC